MTSTYRNITSVDLGERTEYEDQICHVGDFSEDPVSPSSTGADESTFCGDDSSGNLRFRALSRDVQCLAFIIVTLCGIVALLACYKLGPPRPELPQQPGKHEFLMGSGARPNLTHEEGGHSPYHPTYFVTIETKHTPLVNKVGAPFETFNIGLGRQWDGFKTKFEYLLPFLENRTDTDLIAFFDGFDVFWGGCDMEDFLRSYHKLVKLSGAPIVISAELACGEQKCWSVPKVPSWASHMSHKNLGGGFWEEYLASDGCKSRCCPCAKPPAVMFLNSGFMMGPVSDMRAMVRWSLKHYDSVSTLGDQSVIAYYWSHIARSKITLDYAGELCLTMSDLKPSALFKLTAEGHIWNKAFNRKQCFIHGNGRSRGPMWDLLGKFTNSPAGGRYKNVWAKPEKVVIPKDWRHWRHSMKK